MKKILSPILLVGLFAVPSVSLAFSDISDLNQYKLAIDFLQQKAIVQGYPDGTYRPFNTLNRAELLKIVLNAKYGVLVGNNSKCFSDIDATAWYAPYVCYAKTQGIVQGYTDGTFKPAQDINFVEALKISMVTYGFNYSTTQTPWYADLVSVAQGYQFVSNQITSWTQPLNRGQMADLLTRVIKYQDGSLTAYLNALQGQNPIPTPSPVPSPTPTPTPTPSPVPSPTPTPVPSPSPQPSTGPVVVQPVVKDSNGNPIVGAEVHLVYQNTQGGKIYRYDSLIKSTDNNGSVTFTENELITALQGKTSLVKPYSFFLESYKGGYVDTYVYDNGEQPKMISEGTWAPVITMNSIQTRLSQQSGNFTVSYYPGQESCVSIAFSKMQTYYPQIVSLLGTEAPATAQLKMTFNTRAEQGSGDWTASLAGVATQCYPWTDNITDASINDMWNEAIPHEFGHVFVGDLSLPYWSNEGMAQFVNYKTNNKSFNCNASSYLAVQDLTGENLPYYDTAACFWKGLDDSYSGFVKNAFVKMKANKGASVFSFKTSQFITNVLVPALVENYGMSQSAAQSYIDQYMTQFKYDPNKA